MGHLKRTVILLAAALALAFAGLAVAGGKRAKIKLRKTHAGKILVNGRGFTLYEFAKDKTNQNNCIKFPTCMMIWPPVTTSGTPIAGRGIHAKLLGTITLPDGRHQVTYAGHPLYTYIADGGPGETSYIGKFQSGGRWYALNARGGRVSKR